MSAVHVTVATAIERGLEYLERVQMATGQFPMEVSVRRGSGPHGDQISVSPERSPFCTALIVTSLAQLEDTRRQLLTERAVAFLEREMERGSLWRYWCKGTPMHAQVPPDADDTACVSLALREAGRPVPENADLLIANRNRGGLFYTWFALRTGASSNPRWWWTVGGDVTWGRLVTFWRAGANRHDVDAVVNANVVRRLGERPETSAAVDWLLDIAEKSLEEKADKWYRSAAAFYYAVSKCHAQGMTRFGALSSRLAEVVSNQTHSDGSIGIDALQTAMFLSATSNFGMTLGPYRKSVEFLVGAQEDDGGWGSLPIYCDGRAAPLITFASRAATTGFAIEALSAWERRAS